MSDDVTSTVNSSSTDARWEWEYPKYVYTVRARCTLYRSGSSIDTVAIGKLYRCLYGWIVSFVAFTRTVTDDIDASRKKGGSLPLDAAGTYVFF